MPAIDIGDPLPNLAVRVENPPGTAVNVGAMALTIKLPDGTLVPQATPSNPSTGSYVAASAYIATTGGPHVARWVGTGANACVLERTYSVGDPVDIDEIRKLLKVAGTTTDDVLYGRIAAATATVERLSGRSLRTRTVTDVRPGGKYAVALSQRPVGTILTVTENGSALVAGDYTLNALTGLLYRGSGRSGTAWAYGPNAVTVTYTTTSEPVPAHLVEAVIEQTRHLVAGFRGGSGQPQAGEDVPAKVRDLIGARIPRF